MNLLVPRPIVLLLGGLVFAACSSQGIFSDGGADQSRLDASSGDLPVDVSPPKVLTIEPLTPQVVVETGKPVPTVQLVAKLDGTEVQVNWAVEKALLGSIATSGLFTPSGNAGGQTKIFASIGVYSANTTLTVRLKATQNGAIPQDGDPGPGGFGGVGGEGLGGAAGDDVVAVLGGTATTPAGFKLLYPYDQTVWPLGVLAPLLQWSALPQGSLGQGVLIELTAPYFEYKGTFGRPAALTASAPFLRHPIPQNVWKAATRSAAGGTLSVKITVASEGTAYGPLAQTWTVAEGNLRGTVYYQSYGSKLVQNNDPQESVMGGGRFGGATLAIKGGSTDPVLVAGATTADTTGCRVCHSVSANGSRMIVQHGENYKLTSSYDLLNGYKESSYQSGTAGKLAWSGMTPDGNLGLGHAVSLAGSGAVNTLNSELYDMATGAVVQASGLSSFVTRAAFPSFAPNSARVAFNFYDGAGTAATGTGDPTKLVVMSFDLSSKAFSNPVLVFHGSSTEKPGWPAFWPTSTALLFQVELPGNTSGEFFATRLGGRGELRWVDPATGSVAPLHRLNGKNDGVAYLPTSPNNHDNDAALNYEPTVSPIASGGYAWVVFTSRRLYGNVVTIDPWASDPREVDLTVNVNPRKLWVAAVDLNPKSGTDPSHPAFYLPAQELMAANSRGYWVADPCKPNGQPCEGGDECCGGFCVQTSSSGAAVCGQTASGCSKEYDKCTQSAECCDYPKFQCVNSHCARWTIQ